MTDKVDICRFFPTLGGTTDWTYSSTVTGYQSPTLAGVVTSAPYSFRAESADLTQWEIATGLFDGTKFLRTTVLYNSSGTGTLQGGAGTKINFTAVPQVALVVLATDVMNPTIYPNCRLTLTSATPVMQTSVAAATRVYLALCGGNRIPLMYGTRIVSEVFAEVFQDTTDATKSPAACAANKNYDMFFWNDAGTQRCTRGPTWDSGAVAGSDTARGTGAGSTELIFINGLAFNKYAITNGPAAQQGLYVGTIRTNGTSTVDYIFGTTAAGGGMASFNVWNAYNRVSINTLVADSTDNWTYSTASTWRAANNSATMRVNMVRGLNEDGAQAKYSGIALAYDGIRTGIGLDTTTAFSGTTGYWPAAGGTIILTANAEYSGLPGLGFHYLSANEYVTGTSANTFQGDNGNAVTQTGFHASLRA